jgi:3-oxoacyl-[acyl-carrier protein] reductase
MPDTTADTISNFILITGASSDIGVALIRRVMAHADQPKVLAHSFRGGARLEALQAEFGDRLQLVKADCSDTLSVSTMAEEIVAQFGAPARFVHLPALRPSPDRFTKFNLERFREDMAVQVESAVILLKKFLPRMSKMPGARVVFMLSSYTHGMPPKYTSMYTVAKYAQLGLMRSLAAEYAATQLRVNSISPSMIETQFLQDLPELAVEMSATSNPQGRNAVPADVLGAIEFLLSPAAGYITGIDIPIAGGSCC